MAATCLIVLVIFLFLYIKNIMIFFYVAKKGSTTKQNKTKQKITSQQNELRYCGQAQGNTSHCLAAWQPVSFLCVAIVALFLHCSIKAGLGHCVILATLRLAS
jgi:hypothetical protein